MRRYGLGAGPTFRGHFLAPPEPKLSRRIFGC